MFAGQTSIRSRLTFAFIGLAAIPLLLAGGGLAVNNYLTQRAYVLSLQSLYIDHTQQEVIGFLGNVESELYLLSRSELLLNEAHEQQRNLLSRYKLTIASSVNYYC
jgi:hypothetical protein